MKKVVVTSVEQTLAEPQISEAAVLTSEEEWKTSVEKPVAVLTSVAEKKLEVKQKCNFLR
jgi:PHD/YefM family antitoxin component YafN of YafNO toxin-antitoxin module